MSREQRKDCLTITATDEEFIDVLWRREQLEVDYY